MRFVFLSGGLLGFAAAALTGWLSDRPADRILFDASVGGLVGALLFKWFWSVVLKGMREVFLVRQRARVAAATPNKAKS